MRTSLPVLALLLLAACTSSPVGEQSTAAPTAPPPAGVVRFVGDDTLQWADPDKQVPLPSEGELGLEVVCDGTAAHNVVIGGVQDDAVLVSCTGRGGTGRDSVAIAPGTYTYWCEIPGHRAAGMEGELTVDG